MLELSPDLQSEVIAIAEPHEAFYDLKVFGYPIGINWAAETIQRLKMIYMQSSSDYDGLIASCQNVDYPPQDERIGTLDYATAQFILTVTEELAGSELVAMPLRSLLEKALDIYFD